MEDDLRVSVSDNKMAAFIRLPQDRDVSAQELRDALSAEGVTVGISPIALRKALTGRRGVFYQIAWGKEPGDEHLPMPMVIYKFPSSQGTPPAAMKPTSGFRVAWKRLQDRGAVAPGDILAFLRNADRYPRSLTVTGEERTKAGFPSTITPGKNAKISLDGTSIVATRQGVPYQDEGVLGVLDHIEILGDIGRNTGDVSFPGDLTIRGSVEQGYRVSATGNIMISGNLWGSATTRARILVSGGINAPGEIVEARMGVTCRFCENSLVRSAGPVKVEEAVIHSVIEADDRVDVSGEKGRIVGGLVRATVGVSVTTAGSPMGIPTVFETGVSPKLRHEQARMEREIAKVRADLDQVERAGSKPNQPDGDLDMVRLLRMKQLWKEQEELLTRRLEAFNDSLARLPKGYFDAMHVLPGVKLVMGAEVIEIKNPAMRVFKGVDAREAH